MPAEIFMRIADKMSNWPLMPRPKGCPRCGAGSNERLSFMVEGSVRRPKVLSGILFFVLFFLGVGIMVYGFFVGSQTISDLRWYEHTFDMYAKLVGAPFIFTFGLYLVSWAINYMHYRRVAECYRCGWKSGQPVA